MTHDQDHRDERGLPVGRPVPGWTPRPTVEPVTLTGRTCRVVPWHRDHAAGLHDALDLRSDPTTWAYYPNGPYADAAALAAWQDTLAAQPTSVPHVITTPDGRPVGVSAYLRLDATNGSVEVGSIVLADELKRTTAATEAMVLMMAHAFDDLGYRRYEWKCDSHNEPSRRAAARLGFTHEGRFRNAVVYRGRNRDTDWFSITDDEWPSLRAEFERWLDPGNFDTEGRQLTPLATTARPAG